MRSDEMGVVFFGRSHALVTQEQGDRAHVGPSQQQFAGERIPPPMRVCVLHPGLLANSFDDVANPRDCRLMVRRLEEILALGRKTVQRVNGVPVELDTDRNAGLLSLSDFQVPIRPELCPAEFGGIADSQSGVKQGENNGTGTNRSMHAARRLDHRLDLGLVKGQCASGFVGRKLHVIAGVVREHLPLDGPEEQTANQNKFMLPGGVGDSSTIQVVLKIVRGNGIERAETEPLNEEREDNLESPDRLGPVSFALVCHKVAFVSSGDSDNRLGDGHLPAALQGGHAGDPDLPIAGLERAPGILAAHVGSIHPDGAEAIDRPAPLGKVLACFSVAPVEVQHGWNFIRERYKMGTVIFRQPQVIGRHGVTDNLSVGRVISQATRNQQHAGFVHSQNSQNGEKSLSRYAPVQTREVA